MDALDLLLHPIRLRIVHVMSDSGTHTTSQVCTRLPDVPKTTVYRHVGLLVEGGVLEVADEQRVHGAVERHYRLRRERYAVDQQAAEAMSLEDHRRGFTAAMAAMIGEFGSYLDRDGADPATDGVGYRQGVLWLSREELAEVAEGMRRVYAARAGNGPAPGRAPYLVSAVFFPTATHRP
ncbi:helix-turn-helix domain-containing protein [Saccharothrix coeruleofusca]|uniref:Transcriptional regulator n=1 Tax=Saccharothrix coeruleofusca TaxID=33919 RepID=A0A918AP87_9PSEU|nr:helix-turn-helix domain-containing protein [Saccharothrix coeruleofusca]MBP2336427.1 DNA-binding transcriptional ArsR family regulator [Saccharothrix coeruleofusca]GGP53193.1 transcriptional regulator [Saccharothrix coeruleofusca]